MLLRVERVWVEEASDEATSWYDKRQELAKHVCNDCEEDNRDEDDLRLEVLDLLKNRAKGSQTETWGR